MTTTESPRGELRAQEELRPSCTVCRTPWIADAQLWVPDCDCVNDVGHVERFSSAAGEAPGTQGNGDTTVRGFRTLCERADDEAAEGRGQVGRSLRSDVRNPVLALPAFKQLCALDTVTRKGLYAALMNLRADARMRAQKAWTSNKGFVAAYWKTVGTYAGHTARSLLGRKSPPDAVVLPTPELPQVTALREIVRLTDRGNCLDDALDAIEAIARHAVLEYDRGRNSITRAGGDRGNA